MAVVAKLNHLKIAPRKVRMVADMVRGKSLEEAQNILSFTVKGGAMPLLKLIKTAAANAKNNFQLEEANLYISKILVDEGRKYKRWMPRARGSASEIKKRTSHITLLLEQIKPAKIKKIKKATAEPEPELEPKLEPLKEEKKVEAAKAGKPRPKPELETLKPKSEKGIRRIFRRKAF